MDDIHNFWKATTSDIVMGIGLAVCLLAALIVAVLKSGEEDALLYIVLAMNIGTLVLLLYIVQWMYWLGKQHKLYDQIILGILDSDGKPKPEWEGLLQRWHRMLEEVRRPAGDW